MDLQRSPGQVASLSVVLNNDIKSKIHSNLLNDALTLLPTLSKYSWNLFSTSLERFVQLLRIFSICSCWLSQVRWKVSWWGNRLLIRFRKSLVTVLIPSKGWAKSSLHFLVKKQKHTSKHTLMCCNLDVFSYTLNGAYRQTDGTWCRWRAAPSAWCSPCAAWWRPGGVCLGLWGPRLSRGSGTELSGWSLPRWGLS